MLFRSILIEKDDPDIHWRLGTVYLKINDLKNALNCFQIAVNLGSGQPKYLLWLSTVENSLGNSSKSFNIIQEVLEKDPYCPEAWQMQGKNLIDIGLLKEGIESINRSLDLNPDNIEGWNALGCIYLENNENLKALEAFNQGLKINHKHLDLLFNIGLVYIKFEKYAESIKYLEKAKKYKMQ